MAKKTDLQKVKEYVRRLNAVSNPRMLQSETVDILVSDFNIRMVEFAMMMINEVKRLDGTTQPTITIRYLITQKIKQWQSNQF